jgi:hypothetical protein
VCGRGVEATGPDRWRHVGPGRAPPQRSSKWLAPGLRELRACATYEQFAATYPWAVRAGGGLLATTEGHWREAIRRLELYHARLPELERHSPLAAGDNPYLDLVRILGEPAPEPADPIEALGPTYWGLPYGLAQILDLSERRRELVDRFAWAIPTDDALETVARYGPLVDAGAGTGYWAALLQARGADAVATDLAPPGAGAANEWHRHARRRWTKVAQASAVDAVRRHRGRTLLLCWPPYDDDSAGYAPLRAYRGEIAIHVGGEASGSVRFHRELALNWTLVEEVALPHWPRLDDRVHVYRRNEVRLPHRVRDRCDECRRFLPTGSLGRCDACFERRPPALALRAGRHRAEYTQEQLESLPPALRKAFEASPQRIV